MKVLITGAGGFIGRNAAAALGVEDDWQIFGYDQENSVDDFHQFLAEADCILHLAGVNRPENPQEFQTGNADFTADLCDRLLAMKRAVPLLLSSSIQAELDNPYGRSKRRAEEIVTRYAEESGAQVFIYRLTNVFGKWCRPNYNSVVATFCHNISRGLPITISNRSHQIELVHVDDVVAAFAKALQEQGGSGVAYRKVSPAHAVTLGELADKLYAFKQMRQTLLLPDFSDPFTYKLYGTYLSYLPEDSFAYDLQQRCDNRGCLAEFVKAPAAGQIFVSRTVPGITRGNHFHHLKTEKFLVLEGEAIVRFRHIEDETVLSYPVRGDDFRVIDIPPGYTHSIENIGEGELVTLFWASEIFNPDKPDTIYEEV
jgi:UDP-2-acetamido-2,6-beta-L-arabino-hexul-4-ose reductase